MECYEDHKTKYVDEVAVIKAIKDGREAMKELTTLERGVQIVTLNDLESYKEYSPYTLINNEVDFIRKVVNM